MANKNNIFKNIFGPKKKNNSAGQQMVGFNSWESGQYKGIMINNTSNVEIGKEHLYRGVGFGIIRSVVNSGLVAAEDNIRTTCSTLEREKLAKNNAQIEHPYRTLWRNSPYFSEYDFWKEYLTYIQLKGEFFIYMNREPTNDNKAISNKMTPTSYMKIINPYEMKPLQYDENGNVVVWRKTEVKPNKKKFTQDIPASQIIHIIEKNPWDSNVPYSLLDASKENLFTLENAKDFTRHALVGNINAPGMITVEGEFQSQEDFDAYVSRLKHHEEGEMIVAAGNAKTTFQSLNQNLDGTSQEHIRNIERDEMLIATGVSKSVLGVETSGLTRDVAATQKLTFTERTVIPYIKLMIETLNFDYRTNYAADFLLNKYILHITIPSIGDKTQEQKELEIRETEYEMVQKFVDRGYTRRSAAQYVRGEIDVEQLQLEEGEKARMSAKESVDLVDSAERWQTLISAGNDPQTVIDLIKGEITMAEFIELNKEKKIATPTEEKTEEPTEPLDEDEKKKPEDYYDPSPEDYSTPRDLKETPADKKKKKK